MDLVPNAPLSERESKLSKRVKKILLEHETFKPIQRRHLKDLEWQPGFRCACVDPRLVDGRYANALNTTGMFALDVRPKQLETHRDCDHHKNFLAKHGGLED